MIADTAGQASSTQRRFPAPVLRGVAVFLVTLTINLLSASPGLSPVTYPDTASYLQVARQFLHHDLPYLHLRTPGYPIALALTETVGSWQNIVSVQAVVGAMAAVLLWRILRVPLRSETWAVLAAVVIMSDCGVATWHGIALTESLSISFVVLWMYAHLIHVRVISDLPARWLGFSPWTALTTDILLMMLRPSFFFLPALWYVALLATNALRIRGAPQTRSVLTNLAIVALMIAAWCTMIWGRYGRFEITLVSRYNRLGNLIALGFLSPHCPTGCSPLVNRGTELASLAAQKDLGPYAVAGQLSTEFKGLSTDAIVDSLNVVFAPPFGAMQMRAMKRLRFVMSQHVWQNLEGRLIRNRAYQIYSLIIDWIYTRLAEFALAWSACFVYLAYRVRRDCDPDCWVRFGMMFVAAYIAGVNVLGAYADFARLMSPAVVLFSAMIILLAVDLIRGTLVRLKTDAPS